MRTVKDFLDMMEKNGYKKRRDSYIFYDNKNAFKVIGACAFGQAALNMDIEPTRLMFSVEQISNEMCNEIIKLNDHSATSVPDIARKMKEKYPDILDVPLVNFDGEPI